MRFIARALFASVLVGSAGLAVQAPPALAQVSEADEAAANSAIMHAGKRAAEVAVLKRVPSVGVIRLDVPAAPRFLWDGPAPQDFEIMAQRFAPGIARLQRALAANPVTRDALAQRNVSAGQVAGVQVSGSGALRLYIFSR